MKRENMGVTKLAGVLAALLVVAVIIAGAGWVRPSGVEKVTITSTVIKTETVGAQVVTKTVTITEMTTVTMTISEEEIRKQLVEKAKEEGEIMIYTSLDIERWEKVLIPAFKKTYPFIEVKVIEGSSEDLRQRVMSEAKAGIFKADVIQTNTADVFILQKEGILLNGLNIASHM